MDYLAHMPAETDRNQTHKNVKLNSKLIHMFLIKDHIHVKIWRRLCYNLCNMVCLSLYEGWNFNSGNYLFTTDTK